MGGVDCDGATARSEDIRKAKTAGIAGHEDIVAGTMPEIAGRTITPGASQQTVNGGGYLSGNVVVPGFSMPAAGVVKKGVTLNIYGRTVTGTFEGYVATPADLYLRGQNIAKWTLPGSSSNYISFDSGQITVNTYQDNRPTIAATFNARGFSWFNIEVKITAINMSYEYGHCIYLKESKTTIPAVGVRTLSWDISAMQLSQWDISFAGIICAIYRIWVS